MDHDDPHIQEQSVKRKILNRSLKINATAQARRVQKKILRTNRKATEHFFLKRLLGETRDPCPVPPLAEVEEDLFSGHLQLRVTARRFARH